MRPNPDVIIGVVLQLLHADSASGGNRPRHTERGLRASLPAAVRRELLCQSDQAAAPPVLQKILARRPAEAPNTRPCASSCTGVQGCMTMSRAARTPPDGTPGRGVAAREARIARQAEAADPTGGPHRELARRPAASPLRAGRWAGIRGGRATLHWFTPGSGAREPAERSRRDSLCASTNDSQG